MLSALLLASSFATVSEPTALEKHLNDNSIVVVQRRDWILGIFQPFSLIIEVTEDDPLATEIIMQDLPFTIRKVEER